ncbi:4-alpha-glucanotransferase [Prochlorococcus marinus]|uniref:4-alpha-glucanotransferase n=1 Tax=Prochlorococcus marinus TaxID=1219 RepID=UPI0022B3DC60|nr:4-alpha-glucanotransferase [Prochlorococcus marinus]
MVLDSISKPRFTGILIHPSSLPSKDICGTFGESARTFIKLLAENHISVWQFLPLTPTDSTGSPYSSPSCFALNPWLIDLDDLIEDGFLPSSIINEFSNITTENNIDKIDFGKAQIKSYKIGQALVRSWKGQNIKHHNEFLEWSSNQFWLENHSCFMELRRQFKGIPWWEWPEPFSSFRSNELSLWKLKYKDNLLEHSLLQWHLNRQWNKLRSLSKDLGVLLFGDLPFYVSRDSADVWANRSLFSVLAKGNLDKQSGVPPDYFSETGQLWGTPVYRWSKHKRTNFSWWRSRFKRQWSQVDLLRLDHFRALDSYWSVPGDHKTAKNGCWIPSPGLELISHLKKDFGANLPLVAEDLGVITSNVKKLRDYFGFPGMKILQFAFDGNLDNPYLPENIKGYKWIVYSGTHDNATTNGWWEESDNEVREMVNNRDKGTYNSPAWKLIEIGMNTKTFLFVCPVQDVLSLGNEARLNKPGTIGFNWSWRLKDFNDDFRMSIKKYGELSDKCGRSFKNIHSLLI